SLLPNAALLLTGHGRRFFGARFGQSVNLRLAPRMTGALPRMFGATCYGRTCVGTCRPGEGAERRTAGRWAVVEMEADRGALAPAGGVCAQRDGGGGRLVGARERDPHVERAARAALERRELGRDPGVLGDGARGDRDPAEGGGGRRGIGGD